jgi:putative DNA primase/helicase
MRLPQTDERGKPRASGIAPPHPNGRSEPEGPAQLAHNHLADLRASGLTAETIAAARFRTVAGDEVNKILRWRAAEKLGPCLYFPYLDSDGSPIGFGRVKPDRPRPEKRADGSVRLTKYEQPLGVGLRIYVPVMAWRLMPDVSVPLLVTEGEKKALAAAQRGFACVGLCGVECWSKRREKGPDGRGTGPRELLDDWQAIALRGRVVYVVFDGE